MRQIALSRWTIQVVATSILVLIALLRADLAEVGEALQQANFVWAGAAILVLTLSKLIAAARWQLYLTSFAKLPLLGLMGAYVVGSFLNTVLPLRAGDFAKIQIVASRYGLPRAGLGSSVFVVEAVLDIVCLLALLLVGLTLLNVSFIPNVFLWPFIFVSGAAFAAALLVSHLFPRQMPDWRFPTFFPPVLQEGLRNAWPQFIDGLTALRHSRLLARALSLHMLEWFMRVTVFWLFSLSFAMDVSVSTYLVLVVAVTAATVVPVTFMNIGTFQVVVMEVLGAAGAPRSEAFAYAVTVHAFTNLWFVVMGLVALWTMQLWPKQVISAPGREAVPAEGGNPGTDGQEALPRNPAEDAPEEMHPERARVPRQEFGEGGRE